MICRSINFGQKKENADVKIKTDNDNENIFACPVVNDFKDSAKEEARDIVEEIPEIATQETEAPAKEETTYGKGRKSNKKSKK